ncbi:hypothetical protein Esti_000768 [Eimeria stiedai]
MEQRKSSVGCLPFCTAPCYSLDGGEEEGVKLHLETLYFNDIRGIDDTAFENRGRRLTAADFIGDHPILAVKRKLYWVQRIERTYGGILPEPFRRGWADESSDLGALIPVQADAVLFGEAALRSPMELLSFPSPRGPALAALALLHSLLTLHEDKRTQSTREQSLSELHADGFDESASTGFAPKSMREPIFVQGSLDDTEEVVGSHLQEEPAYNPAFAHVDQVRHDAVEEQQRYSLSADAAEADIEMHGKKQEISRALRTLAFQRRLLQAGGYVLPPYVREHFLGLQLYESRIGQVEGSRVHLHLLNFCTQLVNALALNRSQPGERAIDTVCAVGQQYSYLIGCIQALSSAFRMLAEFKADRDSRALLHLNRALSEEGSEKGVDTETPVLHAESSEGLPNGFQSELQQVHMKSSEKRIKLKKRKVVKKSQRTSSADDTAYSVARPRVLMKPRATQQKSGKVKRKTQEFVKTADTASNVQVRNVTALAVKKKSKRTAAGGRRADGGASAAQPRVSKRLRGNLVREEMPAIEGRSELQWKQLVLNREESEYSSREWNAAQGYSQSGEFHQHEIAPFSVAQGSRDDAESVCSSEASVQEQFKTSLDEDVEQEVLEASEACEEHAADCLSSQAVETTEEDLDAESTTTESSEQQLDESLDRAVVGQCLGSSGEKQVANGSIAGSMESAFELTVDPSFCVTLQGKALQPAFSDDVSSRVKELLAGPSSDSFDYDPLLSLPSKVFRRQVRSIVGLFIRGEVSLESFKRKSLPALRALTFPSRPRANSDARRSIFVLGAFLCWLSLSSARAESQLLRVAAACLDDARWTFTPPLRSAKTCLLAFARGLRGSKVDVL